MKKFLCALLVLSPITTQAQTKKETIEKAQTDLSNYIGSIPYKIKQMDEGRELYPDSLISYTESCYKKLEQWKQEGLQSSDTLEITSYEVDWKGTFGQVEAEFCEKGKARIAKYYDEQLGEHKKLMKNDKYDMIKKQYPSGFFVPGQADWTIDAKILAKSNVWFYVEVGEPCAIDKNNYRYIRYQFDKDQKLAKTTEKTYCGNPGKKALK